MKNRSILREQRGAPRPVRRQNYGGLARSIQEGPKPVREFFVAVFKGAVLPAPRVSLPGWLLRQAARLMETLWSGLRIAGKPPLTRFELAFVSQPRRYRIDKIRQELGYRPPVDFSGGLAGLALAM